MKISIVCANCKCVFERYASQIPKKTKNSYCSFKCKCEDPNQKRNWTEDERKKLSKNNSGKNNPNYGKKWTVEQKVKQSELMKTKFNENPDYAYACGKTNRGKTRSLESIDKQRNTIIQQSRAGNFNHSTYSKELIGLKSKLKFTPEYKEKTRLLMEERGYWIPLESIDEYTKYYKDSNWVGDIFKCLPDYDSINLNNIGLWHYKDNKLGLVRDHNLSRYEGWLLKVHPKIMRHPANCKLLSHSENISKGFKDRKLCIEESKIKLYCLIQDIKTFNKIWFEHDEVLFLINEYRIH